jgi:hypothetical protein
MKNALVVIALAIFIISASPKEPTADTQIKGAWKMLKSKYGDEKEFVNYKKDELASYKMFTGSRWAASVYDLQKKKISGTAGGSYTVKGDQYVETVEYYSWNAATEGKVFTFTLKIENGMLHQFGHMEYQDNPKYLIDEWYTRVD